MQPREKQELFPEKKSHSLDNAMMDEQRKQQAERDCISQAALREKRDREEAERLKKEIPPKAIAEFLHYVGWGQEEQAEAMLKNRPQLALGYGELTEPAKRTFKNMTGFQYAIWAQDWMMWDMILRYLPKEEAAKQLEELNENGTAYGKRFNLDELLKGLQVYIDNYSKWNGTQCNDHFTQVIGNAQRLLPVHYMQEYCSTKRSFFPTPDFTKRHARNVKLDIYKGGKWVTLAGEKAILGWYNKMDRGIVRGERQRIAKCTTSIATVVEDEGLCCRIDATATESCLKTRQMQETTLLSTLADHRHERVNR